MEIDWITVSAQVVNFLILVWLLKRFLYQPVIRAMEQREQRIADRLNEAEDREQQAEDKGQRYQEVTEDLERKREEILAEARHEAEQNKRLLLDEARKEVSDIRKNWQRQASEEKEEFLVSLRLQAAEATQAIARKVLADLADAELEERIIHAFIAQLGKLDKESRKEMAHTPEAIRISSAFELDSAKRSHITRAIHQHLADDIEVIYTQSKDLLCGIELSSAGRRLSWNIADYLEELKTRIEQAFSSTETVKQED
jgi:F-type H+-transporting ATPase subunit b